MNKNRCLTSKDCMQIAVQVGMQNLGRTGINPSVGAIITQDNIAATGVTGFGGLPHAETIAIENAKNIGIDLTKSTLYVTLEPCSHYGRTPPCVKAIIREKIPYVVIGISDPDTRVNGNGVKFLRENGVCVEFCTLDSIKVLHEKYLTIKMKNRPFVTLKIAQSLDGKIALSNGESKWITSAGARSYTNFLRSKFDGILVGAKTVRMDMPLLDCRIAGLEIFSPKKFVASKMPIEHYTNVTGSIDEMLCQIQENGVQSILIEGGANLITQFLKANIFDEIILVTAPIFLGSDSTNAIEGLNLSQMPSQNLKVILEKNFDESSVRIFSNMSSLN